MTRPARRASVETLKALSRIDDARRKLAIEASKSAPIELSESESWTLTVKHFMDWEKSPISSPRERVEDAFRLLEFLHSDDGWSSMEK